MLLYSKMKNVLCKIVTKSQVVTRFNVTESRLHCIKNLSLIRWQICCCKQSPFIKVLSLLMQCTTCTFGLEQTGPYRLVVSKIGLYGVSTYMGHAACNMYELCRLAWILVISKFGLQVGHWHFKIPFLEKKWPIFSPTFSIIFWGSEKNFHGYS